MNRSQRFVCRNTFIKPDNDYTAVTRKLSNDKAYRIPIATGYGRYAAKEETLVQMRHQEQILVPLLRRECTDFGRDQSSRVRLITLPGYAMRRKMYSA